MRCVTGTNELPGNECILSDRHEFHISGNRYGREYLKSFRIDTIFHFTFFIHYLMKKFLSIFTISMIAAGFINQVLAYDFTDKDKAVIDRATSKIEQIITKK